MLMTMVHNIKNNHLKEYTNCTHISINGIKVPISKASWKSKPIHKEYSTILNVYSIKSARIQLLPCSLKMFREKLHQIKPVSCKKDYRP